MKMNFKALDAYLADLHQKKGYAGVSVCIRDEEGIVFKKGYGHRDSAGQLPVDEDTVFGIASMSKSMTTLACAMLQAEGKLNFSDPVTKYFPDFKIPGTPKECVTLRHLAMHTAGLPPIPPLDWSIAMSSPEAADEWYQHAVKTAPNKMDQIEQIIDYIAHSGDYTPLGAPGEYMSYCNEGYAILSYVVDQAAGISLEEFLKVRIFEPLGMTRTVLDLDGSEAIALAGGNITSLFEKAEDTVTCDDDWQVMPPYRGCACVKSTASDITKYYLMLAQKGQWQGRQVVDPQAVELLVGREFPEREREFYCFGLEKRLKGNHLICEHTGGLHGVSTNGGFLDSTYSVAALCNQGNADIELFQWACYNALMGLPLGTSHYWAEPSGLTFSIPQMLVGYYMAKEGMPSYCKVRIAEDGQLVGSYAEKEIWLRHCCENVFAAYSKEDRERISTIEFLFRDGKAWAARCGSRIYQRSE